jgi:hypothetical protein
MRYPDPPATRYLEGEMTGPDHADKAFWSSRQVVFKTTERPSPSGVQGAFSTTDIVYSTHQTRYDISWIKELTEEPDQALISIQGPAFSGTWKLVRCDGKSARAAAIEAAKPLNCPINRVVFIDESTGRRFKAERCAEDFEYVYYEDTSSKGKDDKPVLLRSRMPPKGRNGESVWARHVGYWLLQGTLEGSEAYLKFEQVWGSPCCYFQSYYPGERDLRELKIRWLNGKQVPIITNENKADYTASTVDTVNDFIIRNGPMKGMTLVPLECERPKR